MGSARGLRRADGNYLIVRLVVSDRPGRVSRAQRLRRVRQAWDDLTIRQKILAGYGASLLPLFLLGITMLWVMMSAEREINRINGASLAEIGRLDAFRDGLNGLTTALGRTLHVTTSLIATPQADAPAPMAEALATFRQAVDGIDGSIRPEDPDEAALWRDMVRDSRGMIAAVETQAVQYAAYDLGQAMIVWQRLSTLSRGLAKQYNAADNFVDTKIAVSSRRLEGFIEFSVGAIAAAILLIGALSVLTAALISRRLVEPVWKLQQAAAEIGKGRFHTPLIPESRDEIGQLVSAFDAMRRDLDQLTQLRISVFDAIGEGICVFDAEQRLVVWNKTYESLWQFPSGFLKPGMTFEAILRFNAARGAYGSEEIEAAVASRLDPTTNSPGGKIYTTPDGAVVERQRTRMPGGGWITALRDVTESERLQRALIESEMRLRGFMYNSPVGMTLKDAAGRYLMVNPMIARLAGIEAEAIVGKTADQVWPPHIADPTLARDREMLESNATLTCENHFVRGTTDIWTQEVRFPIRDLDGQTTAIGNIVIDITERKRIEIELQETASLIRGFMDNAPVAISVADTAGRFLMINGEVEKAFGLPAAEIIGRRTIDIAQNAGAKTIAEMEAEMLAADRTVAREVYHEGRNDFAWVYEVKFPIRDQDGRTRAIGGCALDVTERNRSEQALHLSQERLARAQRIAKFGHWVWSGMAYAGWTSGIVEYSAAAADIFGVSASDLVVGDADYIRRFVHPDDHERVVAAYANFKERRKKGTPLEYRIVRPDGAVRTIVEVCEIVAGDPDQPSEVIGTLHDITDRKQIEDQLLDAKELAEQASMAKSQFLASMSHELRTPLNAIIGFSEIITTQLFGPLMPVRYLDCARDIHISGRHLLGIVNDILDTSRIEVGSFELHEEASDLREIVTAAEAMIQNEARRKGIALDTELAADARTVYVDARALRQALINLLGNAVKFTLEGGAIRVKADLEGDGTLLLSVADNGIGIAEQHLGRVFERFAQFDEAYARTHGGIGLGLHITKRLIEMHGGSIQVDSKLGVGTIFKIRLPADRVVRRTA